MKNIRTAVVQHIFSKLTDYDVAKVAVEFETEAVAHSDRMTADISFEIELDGATEPLSELEVELFLAMSEWAIEMDCSEYASCATKIVGDTLCVEVDFSKRNVD